MQIPSINPASGRTEEIVTESTPPERVDSIVMDTERTAESYARLPRTAREAFLHAIADSLEKRRTEIVALGTRETALTRERLDGELTRSILQARFFADVVRDGAFLEATIDHASPTAMGNRPDLRRMLIPLGPVAVFGASNFPLAFSVPGGDTMSALAAGCSVVVKAHESHPALSRVCFDAIRSAAAHVGIPESVVELVYGVAAGAALVAHPAITAVAFTGSLTGGRALLDIISRRENPIPFYGELASSNPVILTPGAVAHSAEQIAEGLVVSVTGSGGQLCTKPGIVFVPRGTGGDAFVAHATRLFSDAPRTVLLNERISRAYDQFGVAARADPAIEVIAGADLPQLPGFSASPRLLEMDCDQLVPEEFAECFGPTTLLARYGTIDDVTRCIRNFPGSLTATIHSAEDEDQFVHELSALIRPRAGRVLYGAFPTGVAVSWAQHHGGPWPSTNSIHTSVGATAIRRFLRPLTWQDAPEKFLPVELRDGYDEILRRVDGRLELHNPALASVKR